MNRRNGKDRILVVDDEPAARFGIRDFLETHGFDVAEAVDCREALEAFRNYRPDAVILDYLLPDGDAFEVMAQIKAATAIVPVLILTAHGSIELAVRAVKEGADQFLTKPMELPGLLSLLREELIRRRRPGQPERAGDNRLNS